MLAVAQGCEALATTETLATVQRVAVLVLSLLVGFVAVVAMDRFREHRGERIDTVIDGCRTRLWAASATTMLVVLVVSSIA